MESAINEAKTKELLKEVVIELINDKQDLFYEIILEALEEIALANAIKEGRQNDFISEDKIFALLEGQAWKSFTNLALKKTWSVLGIKKILMQVKQIIGEIKQAKDLDSLNNLKKMKGYDFFYRIRWGDYRMGIEVLDDEVIISRFLHRKDIYRYFP